jgi:hypothetical protein
MFLGWLSLTSCNKSTFVFCPDFKEKKNSEFVKMDFHLHQQKKHKLKLSTRLFSQYSINKFSKEQLTTLPIKWIKLRSPKKNFTLPTGDRHLFLIPKK